MEAAIAEAAAAVDAQDGAALASALTMDPRAEPLSSELVKREGDISAACTRALAKGFDDVVGLRLRMLAATAKQDFVAAFDHQEACLNRFQNLFDEKDTPVFWLIPVLQLLDRAVRKAALVADAQQRRAGGKSDRLEVAARVLNKSFTMTMTDRAPLEVSKKWGCLAVINELFALYFRMNNLRLCTNLIRAVDGTGFPPFEQFPMAQKVTYKYYVGRLSMLNGNFKQAEEQLMYAFSHCPRDCLNNKRLCLMYLIPTRLVLGKFATKALLRKYSLKHFEPLCAAVSDGDLRAFNEHKEAHQSLYITQGIFLIVERAKSMVYRNLFSKVHSIMGTNKLSLRVIASALNKVGIDIDVDEIECVLANLIYDGLVKGYISHQKRFLVVSSKDPFPSLRS